MKKKIAYQFSYIFRLVPDLDEDSSPSSKSDSSDQEDVPVVVIQTNVKSLVVTDDDELVDGLRNGQNVIHQSNSSLERTNSSPFMGQIERRRRKLPEIPKNKKCRFDKKK